MNELIINNIESAIANVELAPVSYRAYFELFHTFLDYKNDFKLNSKAGLFLQEKNLSIGDYSIDYDSFFFRIHTFKIKNNILHTNSDYNKMYFVQGSKNFISAGKIIHYYPKSDEELDFCSMDSKKR